MLRLFEDEVAEVLGEIACLPDDERRAAMANPRPYLQRAGLAPPEGVSFTMMDGELDDIGRPPDLPDPKGRLDPLRPDDPNILDLQGRSPTPPLVLKPICFRFCFSARLDPRFPPFRRCVYICI